MTAHRRLTAVVALIASVSVVAVGGCSDTTSPATVLTGEQPGAVAPEYVIGPGDALSIFVHRSPELSVDLPVRPDGRISTPLVPDLEAAGKTPTQLARELEGRLKEYVRDPNVTVMVRAFVGPASRQIRVIGEAAQPKAIPYREGISVLDVLIEVGGLTRYASGNRAEIVRRDQDGSPRNFRVRLTDLVRDGDISQDVPMRPGDTLIIPQSWF